MNRTFLTALLAAALIVTGMFSLRPEVITLALPLLVYLAAGLWDRPTGLNLRAERLLSHERALSGDEITIRLNLHNAGGRIELALVEDLLPRGLAVTSGSARHLVSLAAGETRTWEVQVRGQRGHYALDKVKVTASDRLGLTSTVVTLPTHGHLSILPPRLKLRRVAIHPRRTLVFSGSIPAHQGGAGVDFFDVRAYQPGDPPHWINWRASARHPHELYSTEFEQERVADVGIVLDGRKVTNLFGRRSLFEHSVLAASALANTLLGTGNRVGMLFIGRQIHFTPPGYSKLQGERILHTLSGLQVGAAPNILNLATAHQYFQPGSQLVILSSLGREDVSSLTGLRARKYQLLVICPNAALFEAEDMPENADMQLALRVVLLERKLMFQRLSRLGIRVLDWDVRQPFELVARQHLEKRPLAVGRQIP